MWNPVMNDHIQSLTHSIEASFDGPNDKYVEIENWFKQVYKKLNDSESQESDLLESVPHAKGKRKAKKAADKKEDSSGPDESPFDFSMVSESGVLRKSTRSSRAKRTSKLYKSGLSDETFVVPVRTSRAASKAASSKINSQLNLTLSKKLRRPSDGPASSQASDGPRTESMDFQPTSSSTHLASADMPDYDSPQPGPSVVRAGIEAFEKLTVQEKLNTPDGESSQDEETPSKTPFPPARVTRSKALKVRKSGGSTAKTIILKKQASVAVAKAKRLSITKFFAPNKNTPEIAIAGPQVKSTAPNAKTGASSSSSDEKKREELLKKQEKEEEARKKKEEALKAVAEENKRKREEKSRRAAATREAADKQKQELALKLEKEKEERNKKMLLEREEKLKEEQAKKRNVAAQKAAEIEERRRQEEAARLARIREVAEEQKRNAALKLREQEEQAAMKRKLEEQKQTKKQGKENKKEVTEYKCTPTRDERPLKKPKTDEDYGLDDASASDSSDDESNPKKEIPKWALTKNRNPYLLNQTYYPKELMYKFMSCKKEVDLTKVFKASQVRVRARTSSAVWTSPLSTTFTRK